MLAPRWWLVAGLFALVSSSGCTRRVFFSQSVRDGLELGAGDATAENALQYFSSHRIVLEREAKSRDEQVAGGRIIVRRGRYIEQVVIRRGTPGIAVDWGEDWVAVSFEEGTSIIFEAQPEGGGSNSQIYRLRSTTGPMGNPVVDFEGRGWVVASSLFGATLQVKRNAAGKRKKRRRVLQGRRL